MKISEIGNQKNDKFGKSSLYVMSVLLLMLVLGFIFSGCDELLMDPLPESASDNVSLSLKVDSPFDANTLNIQSAKLLIKQIQFKQSNSNDLGDVKVGPVVFYLDLSGSVKQVTIGGVPPGTYDRIRFKIHKPEDNETPPDPDFKEGTSGNQRFSAIVKGQFNGQSFVYKSRKSVDHIIFFSSPITVSSNVQINMTMTVNPYEWFTRNSDYMDPRDDNNSNDIDDKIKSSFRSIFQDNDKNGQP